MFWNIEINDSSLVPQLRNHVEGQGRVKIALCEERVSPINALVMSTILMKGCKDFTTEFI